MWGRTIKKLLKKLVTFVFIQCNLVPHSYTRDRVALTHERQEASGFIIMRSSAPTGTPFNNINFHHSMDKSPHA